MIKKNLTAGQILESMRENWAEVDDPVHEFIIYLNRIRDLGLAQARERMAAFNLSPSEFDILVTLRRSPPPFVLSPTELQGAVLITSGGLTKLFYQLEERGLIRRPAPAPAHDKRSKLVQLTGKGRKTAERAMAAVMDEDRQLIGDTLTSLELARLNRLMAKTARAFEGRRSSGCKP